MYITYRNQRANQSLMIIIHSQQPSFLHIGSCQAISRTSGYETCCLAVHFLTCTYLRYIPGKKLGNTHSKQLLVDCGVGGLACGSHELEVRITQGRLPGNDKQPTSTTRMRMHCETGSYLRYLIDDSISTVEFNLSNPNLSWLIN